MTIHATINENRLLECILFQNITGPCSSSSITWALHTDGVPHVAIVNGLNLDFELEGVSHLIFWARGLKGFPVIGEQGCSSEADVVACEHHVSG